jgi:hypothetical protein
MQECCSTTKETHTDMTILIKLPFAAIKMSALLYSVTTPPSLAANEHLLGSI